MKAQNKIQRILSVALVTALLVCTGSLTSFAAGKTSASVTVDGAALKFTAAEGALSAESGKVIAPIGSLARKMNIPVSWDNKTKTATFAGNVSMTVGAKVAKTPAGDVALDRALTLRSGRIYASVDSFGTVLGYMTETKADKQSVNANIVTKVNLTISAAASLKDAMGELQALYAKQKPNTKLNINLAGSGTLQQQIEQGAKVDVFISAASKNMDVLKGKGMLDNATVINLLGNRLVLIVPQNSTSAVKDFSEVPGDSVIKKIALGEPKTVPAGQYAEDVFKYYKNLDAVKAKVVYAKDVREVLTWVESGNADAGVVYSSDAKSSSKVKVIATAPTQAHTPIVYPAAVLKGSANPTAAKDFLNFLNSAEGSAVFVKYGFSTK